MRSVFLFFFCFIWVNIMHGTAYDTQLAVQDHVQRGHKNLQENQVDEATEHYNQALKLAPNSSAIHFYLGNVAFQQNNVQEAIVYYKKAAELNPNSAEIECNIGICANTCDDVETAIQHFSKATVIDPACFIAHTQLALLLEKRNDDDAVLKHLSIAHALEPHNTDIILYIGNILKKQEKIEKAVSYYRKAHDIKPEDPKIAIELANTLVSIDHDDEAIDLYYKVLKKNPTFTSTLHNFGLTLKKLGYVEHAIAIYKKAILQRPDYALAHFSLGLAYLSLGDFDHGWLEYEWRWAAYNEKQKEFSVPRWDGSSLRNKRIYVYAEQGFGDTFQFIRYLPLLKEQGAHVIFHTPVPLYQILALCPYIDTLVTFKDPLPAFDYHISLLSLPLVFNTRVDTIPNRIPYLYADEELIKEWNKKLVNTNSDKCKIGICWQGNANYATTFLRQIVAAKSCHVEHFKTLLSIPDICLYSLQKIHGVDQITSCDTNFFIHTFDDTFDVTHGRFMDTAAVIKNLDLVISIDTSIAHFAAALGTPTWIILSEPADWRWMQLRTDSPWYPNVRLFRQSKRGDWSGVMNAVAHALQEFVNTKKYLHAKIYIQPLSRNHPSSVERQLMRYIATVYANETVDADRNNKLAAAYAIKHDLAYCYL
jgi:tetratricopeptide (TPR) repeat protein